MYSDSAVPRQRQPEQQPSSLEKGIAIPSSLCAGSQPLTLAQLCRATGLSKSTTHRLLGVLAQLDLARRIGTEYVLGDQLGVLFGGRGKIPGTRRVILPHMLYLYEQTRQTVNLSVAHGLEVRHIERIYGVNRVRSPSDGIDRAPLHCTASGKVLLAFDADLRRRFRDQGSMPAMARRTITRLGPLVQELAAVRSAGVAYAREELSEGLACVAAPVYGSRGRLRMTLSIAAPAPLAPDVSEALSRSAGRLSSALERAVQRDDPLPK